MNGEREPEDLAALGVLDELAHPGFEGGGEDTAPVSPVGAAEEEYELLRRLYLEGTGLLAYGLEPVTPRAHLRDELLSQLVGDETQEVSPLLQPLAPPPKPASLLVAPPAPIPLKPAEPRHVAEPGEATEDSTAVRAAPFVPYGGTAATRSRKRRWPLALAALFALAAIGFGFWAAQLASEVAYRDARIRRLETDLADSERIERELATTREQLARLAARYAFATAPATTVYALRPPETHAPQPLARGHLFLAANRREWRLEVRGLAAEPEAQDYQLWFIVDGIPMSGGVFDAKLGKTAELADRDMPAGTAAVAITLERKGGVPSPTSPILLIADSSVRI